MNGVIEENKSKQDDVAVAKVATKPCALQKVSNGDNATSVESETLRTTPRTSTTPGRDIGDVIFIIRITFFVCVRDFYGA